MRRAARGGLGPHLRCLRPCRGGQLGLIPATCSSACRDAPTAPRGKSPANIALKRILERGTLSRDHLAGHCCHLGVVDKNATSKCSVFPLFMGERTHTRAAGRVMGRRSGPEGEHYVTSHASSLPMGRRVARHAPHVPPRSPPLRSPDPLRPLPPDGSGGSGNLSVYPPVYPLLPAHHESLPRPK